MFVCTEREIEIFQCLKGGRCGHGAETKVEVIRTWHLVQGVGGATLGIFRHLRGIWGVLAFSLGAADDVLSACLQQGRWVRDYIKTSAMKVFISGV